MSNFDSQHERVTPSHVPCVSKSSLQLLEFEGCMRVRIIHSSTYNLHTTCPPLPPPYSFRKNPSAKRAAQRTKLVRKNMQAPVIQLMLFSQRTPRLHIFIFFHPVPDPIKDVLLLKIIWLVSVPDLPFALQQPASALALEPSPASAVW